MKKILILLIIIIYSIEIEAQLNNKIAVIYKKTIYNRSFKDDNQEINKALENVNNKILEIAKTMSFKLSIIENESVFKLESKLFDNEMYANLAISFGGGSGIYYNNISLGNFYIQKETGGETFLIKQESVQWSLSNETKNIGKYTCYKATTTMTVNNYNKTVKKVTAWYCPELPFSFGPIGYCLLPGLILELEVENTATFTMNSITFNAKHLNVKKPKGNVITPLEYYEISKKAYENK